VRTDTHLRPAHLTASADDLAADWQPFRQLAGHPAAAIMLGHVTLTALDAEHAASHSPAIVDGLLRQAWGYDGLLITDDLNMGAVYRKGIGRVAGEALAAGVDLVLVSYDPRQVYRALAGAAEALAEHRIASRPAGRKRPPTGGFCQPASAGCADRPDAGAFEVRCPCLPPSSGLPRSTGKNGQN
jgi:beta-N-acetylhexosaminidase